MGVEDYLLTSTINGILAQRWCGCCAPAAASRIQALAGAGRGNAAAPLPTRRDITLCTKPVGCEHCGGTGYRGRAAIMEFLVMSDPLRRWCSSTPTPARLQGTAQQEGMDTMYEDGLRKAVAGLTTIEEVLRVTTPAGAGGVSVPRYRYEAVDAAGEVLRDELEARRRTRRSSACAIRACCRCRCNEAKRRFAARRSRSAAVQQTAGIIAQDCRLVHPAVGQSVARRNAAGSGADHSDRRDRGRAEQGPAGAGAGKVRGGSTLADALEAQARIFAFYLNMIRAGEAGGALETWC
jgi:hypothetical protein